ncbi:hypothetical protein [Lignipirellula cremea]|uniref:Uncharacterized protein n=1 Tax=Lignipirellula cremea TaxID=2528010 RepID=A0A518DN88_9BACT|nr:hypothetical protein [Lignipirellula cremea]QDU93283.1 hypothetical protein Pla8534_10630 [Lignipirellula cremea]
MLRFLNHQRLFRRVMLAGLLLLVALPAMASAEEKKPAVDRRARPRLEPGVKLPTFQPTPTVKIPEFSFRPPEPKGPAVNPPHFEAPHVEPPLITPPRHPYVFNKMAPSTSEPLPPSQRNYYSPYLFRVGVVDLYGPAVEISAGSTTPTMYARGFYPMVITPTVRMRVGDDK